MVVPIAPVPAPPSSVPFFSNPCYDAPTYLSQKTVISFLGSFPKKPLSQRLMKLNWKDKTVTKLEREVSPNDSLQGMEQ